MNELRCFYIKIDDFYLQHYNFDGPDVHYTMTKNYNYKFTTDDRELIETLNETIRGTVYAQHACDVKCH